MWSRKGYPDRATLEDTEIINIARADIIHNNVLHLMNERAGIPMDPRMSLFDIADGPCNDAAFSTRAYLRIKAGNLRTISVILFCIARIPWAANERI